MCTYAVGQLKYAKPRILGSAQSNKDFTLCRHTLVNGHRLQLASGPLKPSIYCKVYSSKVSMSGIHSRRLRILSTSRGWIETHIMLAIQAVLSSADMSL